MAKYFLLMALCLVVAGCASPEKRTTSQPALTEAPPEPSRIEENPGSIFNPSRADFLYSDNRARRVGDVVLVNIVEASSGTHKADTKTDKESSINFGISSWFDKDEARLTPMGPSFGLKGQVGSDPMIKADAENEFDGTGETTREANVSATVAARVVQVLPNGLMQIEGGRQVKVNNETQILVVRGLVRQRDIRPDNSILSSYIADAHIEYYGEGVVADKQKPGWLTRILDNVWPF